MPTAGCLAFRPGPALAGLRAGALATFETVLASPLLPAAERDLSAQDRAELDAAFRQQRDPLAGGEHLPGYERLFARILMKAPA